MSIPINKGRSKLGSNSGSHKIHHLKSLRYIAVFVTPQNKPSAQYLRSDTKELTRRMTLLKVRLLRSD
jgi:hypothetical protein